MREQTGLELGYVEQLYTFGDRYRDPRETQGGPRGVSVAYLALVREVTVHREARWRDWYEFFPWEDWRSGRPEVIDRRDRPRPRRLGGDRRPTPPCGRSGGSGRTSSSASAASAGTASGCSSAMNYARVLDDGRRTRGDFEAATVAAVTQTAVAVDGNMPQLARAAAAAAIDSAIDDRPPPMPVPL